MNAICSGYHTLSAHSARFTWPEIKTFPLSLEIAREGIHTNYEARFIRNREDLLYKEDVGTGSGRVAYTIVADYRERPKSFSAVESPAKNALHFCAFSCNFSYFYLT